MTLWGEASRAIRANAQPGFILWTLAAGVVALYFFAPWARPAFDTLASWKREGGYLFSTLSTALFAGVIPFLVLRAVPATRDSAGWGTFLFLTLFWFYRGAEVDLLYRFQAWLFGSEATWSTVAAKVAVDMFVYNVVWAAGSQVLAYFWKESGFRFSAFRGYDWAAFFRRRLPVLLISTWTVWLPVVTLTYSLPSDLQIPLFNLAACFWSLVVATLTRRP